MVTVTLVLDCPRLKAKFQCFHLEMRGQVSPETLECFLFFPGSCQWVYCFHILLNAVTGPAYCGRQIGILRTEGVSVLILCRQASSFRVSKIRWAVWQSISEGPVDPDGSGWWCDGSRPQTRPWVLTLAGSRTRDNSQGGDTLGNDKQEPRTRIESTSREPLSKCPNATILGTVLRPADS